MIDGIHIVSNLPKQVYKTDKSRQYLINSLKKQFEHVKKNVAEMGDKFKGDENNKDKKVE